MVIYRINACALSPSEYETLYKEVDRLAFMVTLEIPRTLIVYLDEKEPLENLITIPNNCPWDKL